MASAAVLQPREKYEDVVDFLENNNDKIKYPDRQSKFIRNSFTLSFLDDYSKTVLEDQQMNEAKDKIIEYNLKKLSNKNQSNIMLERSNHNQQNPPRAAPVLQPAIPARTMYGGSSSSASGMIMNAISDVVGGVGNTLYDGLVGTSTNQPLTDGVYANWDEIDKDKPSPPTSGDEQVTTTSKSGESTVMTLLRAIMPDNEASIESHHALQAQSYQEDLESQEDKRERTKKKVKSSLLSVENQARFFNMATSFLRP